MDGQAGTGAAQPRKLTPAQRAELAEVFDWHPLYRGMTFWQVYTSIAAELRRDQNTFRDVRLGTPDRRQAQPLLQKWDAFDQHWLLADPKTLAATIADFERQREEKRILFAYAPYRRGLDQARRCEAVHGRPLVGINTYLRHVWSWLFRVLPIAVPVGVLWWLLW
jgi:hypothetical protein